MKIIIITASLILNVLLLGSICIHLVKIEKVTRSTEKYIKAECINNNLYCNER